MTSFGLPGRTYAVLRTPACCPSASGTPLRYLRLPASHETIGKSPSGQFSSCASPTARRLNDMRLRNIHKGHTRATKTSHLTKHGAHEEFRQAAR